MEQKYWQIYLDSLQCCRGFCFGWRPIASGGELLNFLNSADRPSCILRTEKIVFHKFNDVLAEIAVAEGEGDLSLEYWRKVHAEIYLPFLSGWGIAKIEDATVVTEYFKLVYS